MKSRQTADETESVPEAETKSPAFEQTHKAMARKGRIMYVESKAEGLTGGEAWIGRVTFSKTGRTLYYRGKRFAPFCGYKANYFDMDTDDEYWISGPKRNGGDRLYGGLAVQIDEDVREEYWRSIRKMPRRAAWETTKGVGKY